MQFWVLAVNTLLVFAKTASAALCPLASDGWSGLGTEYSLTESMGKLHVLDFAATVSYTTLPTGKYSHMDTFGEAALMVHF